MRRPRVDADSFAVLVIACAVMLGCCHGARAEPLHAFAPPTAETWAREYGQGGLAVCLTPDTWETALESVELLDAVTEERDALRIALAAERKVSAALLDERAALIKQVESLRVSLELSQATVFRLEARKPRRGLVMGLSLFAGAIAGAAVSR